VRPLADVMAACRGRGVRLTPRRLAIFDYLGRQPGHPTAEDVYQDLLARHPILSFATVYNTLELLAETSHSPSLIGHLLPLRFVIIVTRQRPRM
jgi:Fe2+ or Zn2+ uptake regulation protein